MTVKFGTSGLRGLVVDLSEALVSAYTRAFLAACPTGTALYVGHDLRASSPDIAAWVQHAAVQSGQSVVSCGPVPTPALAYAATTAGAAAIMVTGSHIPADRNGLKFYTPTGEITKTDEDLIRAALGQEIEGPNGTLETMDVARPFVDRYRTAFGPALKGLRIGVYQHSSVARDMLVETVEALGATALPLGQSDKFVAVDTEAVEPAMTKMCADWVTEHRLDALLSTDGDADRPLVMDAARRIVPGDVLGALTARWLGADVVCTPVNANTLVEKTAPRVIRTKIGSPYVIAAMENAMLSTPKARVAGYEPNGGFLLGWAADLPSGTLAPLITRDSFLPSLAPLAAAHTMGQTLADTVDALPARYTAAARLTDIDPEAAAALIALLIGNQHARGEMLAGARPERAVDQTDGLRVCFSEGDIVHIRRSGNAPEFRCYAEAATRDGAAVLVRETLTRISNHFDSAA